MLSAETKFVDIRGPENTDSEYNSEVGCSSRHVDDINCIAVQAIETADRNIDFIKSVSKHANRKRAYEANLTDIESYRKIPTMTASELLPSKDPRQIYTPDASLHQSQLKDLLRQQQCELVGMHH